MMVMMGSRFRLQPFKDFQETFLRILETAEIVLSELERKGLLDVANNFYEEFESRDVVELDARLWIVKRYARIGDVPIKL